MKRFVFIMIVFLATSCGETKGDLTREPSTTSNYNKNLEENTGLEEENLEIDNQGAAEDFNEDKPYSNPFIIYGSSFGNFFQTMYKHGMFDKMLSFTSKESVKKFGEKRILEFYENELEFGYDIGKRAISSNSAGGVITINYKSDIIATKRIIRINVVIENDSTKIVLPDNLNNFPS